MKMGNYIENSEFGEHESEGPFTYALAATYSWAEDSSNHMMWIKLLGKATEQRLKTVFVPTEIALGPRQNKADILNWSLYAIS